MRRIVFVLSLFIMATSIGIAQDYPEIMPLDPAVKVGKLDNGLTYYIRHHDNPKGRGDFYIANRVGALQEEDNQDGLAHFLEHLAFNGLKHFPDKDMLNFLAANGVKFGANVNAYTSKTRTVYNMSGVPLHRESFIDSVLLILHDWSSYILCEPEQLEAERGVIREEFRRADNSRRRMQEKQDSVLFMGSKYAQRNVIGDFNIINTFERQTLIDFYHKWYRPDMQAVIVVGDFDVADMEQRIIKVLSDLPKVENGAQKEIYTVPQQDEIIVATTTDPDISYEAAKVFLKFPYPTKDQLLQSETYRKEIINTIFSEMMSARLAKVRDDANTPLKIGVVVNTQLAQERKMAQYTLTPKDGKDLLGTLEVLLKEFRRVEQHGFTSQEFDLAKGAVYKKLGLRNDITPSEITTQKLVATYIEHFTGDIPYMEQKEQQKVFRQIFDTITLEDLNSSIQNILVESEKAVIYSMNDKKVDLAPSREATLDLIAKVAKEDLDPFSWGDKDASMLEVTGLQGGSVVKTKAIRGGSSQEWTLSNGVKVVWTPLEGSTRGVDMAVTGYSGKGYISYQDVVGAQILSQYVGRMGVRDFSKNELTKVLSSKDLRTSVVIGKGKMVFEGNASNDQFEQMLSLLYLTVTEPNFNKVEYDRIVSGLVKRIEDKDEDDFYNDTLTVKIYGNQPWTAPMDLESCKRVDVEVARTIYKDLTADMRDFTFFISGTMSEKEVKPLVEKYLASLPVLSGNNKTKKGSIRYAKRNGEYFGIGKVKEIPKSIATSIYHGDLKYSSENYMISKYLQYVLSDRYLKSIREEKGGTYHVGVATELYHTEGGWYDMVVNFETNPKMVDELLAEVGKAIEDLAQDGPTEAEIAQVRKYLLKSCSERADAQGKSVLYRHEKVMDAYQSGVEINKDDPALIESVTPKQVQKLAKRLLKNYNFKTVYSEQYK